MKDRDHDAELERFDAELDAKPYPTCGRKKKRGGRCRKPAGHGTAHPGQGACNLHGGQKKNGLDRRLKAGGRYAMVTSPKVLELAEEMARIEDDNPLDLLPELSVARALFADYVEKCHSNPESYPLDWEVAMRLLAEVTKAAKRIEDVRSHNAISQANFYRVLQEMGRVVDSYVDEEDVRVKIRDGWLAIRLG